MSTCIAIKADGKPCNAKGKVNLSFGSYCLRHFNLSFAKDEKFRQQVKTHDPKLYEHLTNDSDSDSEDEIDNEKVKEKIKKPIKVYPKKIKNEIEHLNIVPVEKHPIDDVYPEIMRLLEKNRIAEEERIAALNAANAHRDITFARDPEGSIDLKAFAKDQQSIHRSSVQDETKKSVEMLLTRPIPHDQQTLEEIIHLFVEPKNFYWKKEEDCVKAIDEITKDYHSAESFGYKFADVCDRVWMFIKEENKKDPTNHLNLRLACETLEGIGMCANGKIVRLINILKGFDTSLDVPQKSREYFQCKMSIVRKLPKEKRKEETMQLFEIFEIPESEQEVWLNAVMDDDD